MNTRKHILTYGILGLILIIAASIRLSYVSRIPPGINRDEGSIGYTAYSILLTGKDEYGQKLPLSFRSFGDWKLPLYIYTTVPFVKFLGLNELAVRLPSVIAGIATVAVVFFLVVELIGSVPIALLSCALTAISPWHIHLSRVESESNVAVLMISMATLLFLKGRKKSIFLIPSSLLFALTYYTYHGNHIFTTLYLAGLVAIYAAKIRDSKNRNAAIILLAVLVGIILTKTLTTADTTKISGISIFGDPAVVHEKIELPRSGHADPNSFFSRLVHNKLTYATVTIAQNYMKGFSPDFLFIRGGGNNAHNVKGFGNMHIVEAPFLLFGLLFLFAERKKPYAKLLLWWLAVSPVAASITKDAPHTNRMFAIFPALPITVALGLQWFYDSLWPRMRTPMRILSVTTLTTAWIICLGLYVDAYFIHFPKNEAGNWGWGYRQLVNIVSRPENLNKHVVITNPEYSPYIYILFYAAYDPSRYQQEKITYPETTDGFSHVQSFGRFEFRAIRDADRAKQNTILVELSPDTTSPAHNSITLPSGEVFASLSFQ